MIMISKSFTGAKNFRTEQDRECLQIVCTSGTISVGFHGGDGKIPLVAGGVLEPYVTPSSSIEITGTGSYTITSNALTEV